MIASPSQVMQTYLIKAGYGNLPPHSIWPIYYGFLPGIPAVPANVIAVYDPVGYKDGRIMKTGETIVHPGIQLRVRSSTYSVAYDKMQRLAKALDNIRRESIIVENELYVIESVTRAGSPISLGLEESTNRVILVVNSLITLSGGPVV